MELVKKNTLPFKSIIGEEYGKISGNLIKDLKYHIVIMVSMITRYCINGGLIPDESYRLGYNYIRQIDMCKSEKELNTVYNNIIETFTNKMKIAKTKNIRSKQIIAAVDYIDTHIYDKLSIKKVADYVSLSVSYMSKLFQDETGYKFSECVTLKKVETASRMFKNTQMSTSEICNALNFSSQSYFIKVFKKCTGMTPKEYKNKYIFMNNTREYYQKDDTGSLKTAI